MTPHFEELAATRERIAALQSDRKPLADNGLSRSDLVKQIKAYATSLDESFSERIRLRLANVATGNLEIADVMSVRTKHDGTTKHDGIVDFAPILVAVLGPKKFADALTSHASHVPDGASTEHRATEIERIDAELADLCRIEELQVRALEDAGHDVLRREDAPPLVVLAPTKELQA